MQLQEDIDCTPRERGRSVLSHCFYNVFTVYRLYTVYTAIYIMISMTYKFCIQMFTWYTAFLQICIQIMTSQNSNNGSL